LNIYYYNSKGYFIPKTIPWDHKEPITSITFDPKGNKFICNVKNPKVGQRTTLLYVYKLHDDNFVLYRTTEVEGKYFSHISFDLKKNSCLITQSSTSPSLDKGIYYWDNIDQQSSQPRLVYKDHSPTQVALSPNGQLCVFTSNPDRTYEQLYYFYTSNCMVHTIETSPFNTRSLTFSKDSKSCSIIRQRNDLIDQTTTISKKSLSFGDQELRDCSLGTATLLHNVFEELLKHRRSQIVRKPLAYELLYYRLPIQLREFLIKILKINTVDYLNPRRRLTESKEDEQEFPDSELEEVPYDIAKILTKKAGESALKDLGQYLEQAREEPTMKHTVDFYNPPKTLSEKIITSLSTMGNYIYPYLPSRLQRVFKKENPITEEELLNLLQENDK